MPSLGNLVFGVVLVVVLLGMAAGGVGMLWVSIGRAERSVRFFLTRPSAIADIVAGDRVRVQGRVRTEQETVTTPLFGSEVVAASCEIEQLEATGQNSRTWSTEHQLRVGTPFELTDGVATVTVDPTDVEVRTADDRTVHRSYPTPEEVPDGVREFARRFDIDDVPAGQGLRYTERTIEPGDEVLVYGVVESQDGTSVVTGDADRWSVVATQSVGRLLGRQLFLSGMTLALGIILLSVPLMVVLWGLSWAGML